MILATRHHLARGLVYLGYHENSLSDFDLKHLKNGGGVHDGFFILKEEKISSNKKFRKYGIWQHNRGDVRSIFFTCPWCGHIGETSTDFVDRGSRNWTAESLYCTSHGCRRHLFLIFRSRGNLKGMVEI